MKYTRLLGWVFLSAVSMSPIVASVRYELCSQIVETALEAANEVCDELGRNLACYGHRLLSAEAQDGVDSFQFEEAGDMVEVASLNSLRLSPMNVDDGTWGVALMNVQANIPDEMPENVNLVLFGDVEVENLVREPVLMNIVVNASGNANVRRQPDSTSFVMASIASGTVLQANGRSEDGSWISVGIPDTEGEKGWVSRDLIESAGDLSELNVLQSHLNQYGPMQAFYLRSGDQQSTCAEAPNDGLLVQTPEGVAEVRLWINEVKIRLGSTAFIQAQAGNQMSIKTLEGKAIVEAMGVEQVAVAGTGVLIQLNADLAPSSPPSAPKAYQRSDVQNLPVRELDRPIDIEIIPPTAVSTAEPSVPTIAPLPETQEPVQPAVPATLTPTNEPTSTPIDEVTPTEEPAGNPDGTGAESTSDASDGSAEPAFPEVTDSFSDGNSSTEVPSESLPEETPEGFISLIGNLLLSAMGNWAS